MKNIPTTLILFGGTGDLASRKLLPALYDLYNKGMLPEGFKIVGFSRKDLSNEEYREYVSGSVEGVSDNFLSIISYCSGDILKSDSYAKLSDFLHNQDGEVCSNKMYYLAVPPNLYHDVFNKLSESGLTLPCRDGQNENNWSRVLVEKPFGFDKGEAMKLDELLGYLFQEDQVYRIDHYLGKETIQNILTFRFSNPIFQPIWNRDNIDRVDIKMHEEVVVTTRGSFFDSIGALRDVGQNHVLQMLAFVAMEPPADLKSELIRRSREDVLRSVKVKGDTIRGQYKGYEKVEGVKDGSTTETYFKIGVEVDNDRWRGVPFVLESGKGLPEKITEINIFFKEGVNCISSDGKCDHQNVLTFKVYPEEGISLKFWRKKPGFSFEVEEKELSFSYKEDNTIPDAYERVLHDAIIGDQTLFISTNEVMSEWDVIMPILESWDNEDIVKYEVGEMPRVE